MSNICEIIKQKRIYFDGGMGTMLQHAGLKSGEVPEFWNIQHPDLIIDIHRKYLQAGANIITTNTFGVNCLKHQNYDELIKAAINCANAAKCEFDNSFVAFDIGPLGRFLEPIGDISFEDAVEVFAKNIRIARELGVDLIIIETMTDSYETKAAVIAAKENSDLPIFVTNVYDEYGKMLTGATPEVMVAMLEGLGVTALGINCSLGPDKMIHLIERIRKCSSLPIIANPNAGLPDIINGKTEYLMNADVFSDYAVQLAKAGANILGGCCGTNPEYIQKTVNKTHGIPLNDNENKNNTVVSSFASVVEIGTYPILIGERINPTGKPMLKEALHNEDINYLVKLGLDQADAGVHILDVNVGLPSIDESTVLPNTVVALQSVCDLPLQLDSSNPTALEKAMRVYNGKPMINSVNGDSDTMEKVFPLVKKYGGVVIALTLDNNGIPDTAEGRIQIAKRIIEYANGFGIDEKNIVFDPLALTISSNDKNAAVTLETVDRLTKMGLKTSLGISNISFGLPNRAIINSAFLTMALQKGLSCAIVNPLHKEIMDAYYSFCALSGIDSSCADFIGYSSQKQIGIQTTTQSSDYSLRDVIERGLIDHSKKKTVNALENTEPLDLINNEVIPALNKVGELFERGEIYLPQLLNSAECASTAFSIIKTKIPQGNLNGNAVILATVKGDIHDIGKNIVKLLLESYGFTVYDLGKDISPQRVLDAVKLYDCKLVALSALMTTTLDAMKVTIAKLKEYSPDINIMVGGAVLNEEYAKQMGADFYGADAMSAVRYTQEFYK